MNRTIETLYQVKDTEYNRANFAAQVTASFEHPIGTADTREYPASDILTATDFRNLDHIDTLADSLGFDAVKVAIYQDTVTFIIGKNGNMLHAFGLQTAYGFLNGIAHERENRTADIPTLARAMVPAGKVATLVADTLTETVSDDGPDDSQGAWGSPVPATPLPKQPSPNGGTAIKPRQNINQVKRF